MNNSITDIQPGALVRQALRIAQSIAREFMQAHFGPAHLLKAILHKDLGLEKQLWQMDHDVYYLDEWADVRIEGYPKAPAPKDKDAITGDEEMAAVMDEADNIRLQLNEPEISPMHVLIALSTPGVGFSFEQLKTFPLQREALLHNSSEQASLQQLLNGNGTDTTGKAPASPATQALLKFCHDKTLLAAQGKTDPIIGREQETRMMAEILSRRSKPNVMITGEPGVGKSALVDGFALAIVKGEVPAFLQQAKLFELDNGALIAGASYKGEVEERLKAVIREIKAFDKAILFIDEIHVLLDKQGAAGGAANLLKPELARGTLTVIGATTSDEYRKHIEKDEAFARRFELLQVSEPDPETAFRMMQKVIPLYEKHHAIQTDEETLKETVRLARRYIKDKKLPDAAIDLADRAMASLRLAIDTGKQAFSHFRQEFLSLKKSTPAAEELHWHYLQLKNAISPVVWTEVAPEDDPAKITDATILLNLLDTLYEQLDKIVPVQRTQLHRQDIASIVAVRTGIPIGKLQTQEKEKLLNMPAVLRQRVVGQDHAIAAISEAILESRSGLSKPGQPIGSFFFLGPTGTGKTELAKALAGLMFQDEKFMIRFDMSEFKEEHAAALLYGAPPGYVGYEEGGLLVNKIRQQPYSVVLFDEIEKAHASVFDIFLQIMDEGKLHDKLGKEGDFSNAVIIFTSNIASQHVVQSFNQGKTPSHSELLELMAKYFRPEFLGRLTEIISFAPMNQQMVENIFNIQMKDLYALLDKQGISLEITPAAAKQVAQMGFTPEYGARPLAGIIRSELRRPLSKKIISGELKNGDTIMLDTNEKQQWNWTAKGNHLEKKKKTT